MKSLGTRRFKYSGSKLSLGQAKRKQTPPELSNLPVKLCSLHQAKTTFSGLKSLSVYSKVR